MDSKQSKFVPNHPLQQVIALLYLANNSLNMNANSGDTLCGDKVLFLQAAGKLIGGMFNKLSLFAS